MKYGKEKVVNEIDNIFFLLKEERKKKQIELDCLNKEINRIEQLKFTIKGWEEDEKLKRIEEISSTILYLADNSDYKSALYDILREVTGIEKLDETDVDEIARKYFDDQEQD